MPGQAKQLREDLPAFRQARLGRENP